MLWLIIAVSSPILTVMIELLGCLMTTLTLRRSVPACRRFIYVFVVLVQTCIDRIISDLKSVFNYAFVTGWMCMLMSRLASNLLWATLISWVVRVGLIRRRPGARANWCMGVKDGDYVGSGLRRNSSARRLWHVLVARCIGPLAMLVAVVLRTVAHEVLAVAVVVQVVS